MSMDEDFKKIDDYLDKQEDGMKKKLVKEYNQSLRDVRSSLSLLYAEMGSSPSYQDVVRFNRLSKLEAEIESHLSSLTGVKLSLMDEFLSDMYKDNYEKTRNLIEEASKILIGNPIIDDLKVANAIENNLSGLTLPERMALHQTQTYYAIKQSIVSGFVMSKSYREVANEIKAVLEGDAVKAERIARTESQRIRSISRQQVFLDSKDRGVLLYKKWVSVSDMRTRSSHRALDGQIKGIDEPFKIRGMEAQGPCMFGLAKEDVNCRCRIVASFEKE